MNLFVELLKEEMRINVCSNCHPFFSGAQNFASTTGRVEQFKSKFARKRSLLMQLLKNSEEQKSKNKENK